MNKYTTQTCKATRRGAVVGSKYYSYATTMADGTVIESAEVVSAKLDRKAKSTAAWIWAEEKRQAARERMMAEGWL